MADDEGDPAATSSREATSHKRALNSNESSTAASRGSKLDVLPPLVQTLLPATPFSSRARHAPILRANPYPEVTDQICRLPLPTFIYRLEAIDLGDLLRIWVRSGPTLHVALPWIFKVRGEDPDTAATAVLFAFQTISPC